jgi:hypothetical protein
MRTLITRCAAGWLALLAGPFAFAADIVHQQPEDFLHQFLPGCETRALWLKAGRKAEVEQLLERPWRGVRVRYCAGDGRTGWILDEIGKTEPITTGVIVNNGVLEAVRVLVFRESRGGEVHRASFTRQFDGVMLNEKQRLDRRIDGITGATMSVDALNRQARLALLLDRMVHEEDS